MKKQPMRRQKKAIAIIGEGETEQAYFSYIRTSRRYPITIKPDLPSNTDYNGIFRKAKALLKSEYDLVFCLIDLDVIITKDAADQFIKTCSKLPQNIIPIVSNPCTEVWFLMHFIKVPSNRAFNSCYDVTKVLRSHLQQYEKGNDRSRYQRYFSIMEMEGNPQKASLNTHSNITIVIDENDPFNHTFSEISTIFEQLKQCAACNFSIACDACKKRIPTIFN